MIAGLRRSEGKACLADSPGAGERHEPMGGSEAQDFKQAVVPADQLGNRLWQVCRWCSQPWLRRNRASVGTGFHVFSRKTDLSGELIAASWDGADQRSLRPEGGAQRRNLHFQIVLLDH